MLQYPINAKCNLESEKTFTHMLKVVIEAHHRHHATIISMTLLGYQSLKVMVSLLLNLSITFLDSWIHVQLCWSRDMCSTRGKKISPKFVMSLVIFNVKPDI